MRVTRARTVTVTASLITVVTVAMVTVAVVAIASGLIATSVIAMVAVATGILSRRWAFRSAAAMRLIFCNGQRSNGTQCRNADSHSQAS
jgi:hypothetical protein